MNGNEVIIVSRDMAVSQLDKILRTTDACYYLDDNYQILRSIRKSVSAEHTINLCGKRFHEIIHEIQVEFMRMFNDIGSRNRNDAYWGTHLASRNSASMPVLKNIVYFLFAVELLMKQSYARLILICDSYALSRSIEREARVLGKSCHIMLSSRVRFQALRSYALNVGRGIGFLLISLIRWFFVRLFVYQQNVLKPGKPIVLMRSWITAGSISDKAKYIERNFGKLEEYLTRNNKEVWILPMFFNLDRRLFCQINVMSKCQNNFLFQEKYLLLTDILRTLGDGIKGLYIDIDDIKLNGMDVSAIIAEAHLASCLSIELLILNAVKYLMQRLKAKGILIDRFIYPLELNPPEKIFIYAARRWYPGVMIIGFQHSGWYQEHLGTHISQEESLYHPLPDKVVVSGKRYLDILKQTGIPLEILTLGPNLRFSSINNAIMSDRNTVQSEEKKILIILNFNPNYSLEMLEKVGVALRDINDCTIHIKTHPLYPVRILEQFLREINFPPFVYAKDSVQESVAGADAVIMTGGSVSNLETMAAGVPLIRVSLDNNFDFDCLWDEYPFSIFTSSPEEIHQYLCKALSMTTKEHDQLTRFGQHMISEYFEPVSEERMSAFLC